MWYGVSCLVKYYANFFLKGLTMFDIQHLFTLKGECCVELEQKIIMFHRLVLGKILTEKFLMRDNILFSFKR